MKLCFIITCKVYHNYISYLTLYVNNIINFYNDSLIILVDNNSVSSSVKVVLKEDN